MKYTLTMHIDADDDITPDDIRDAVYNACGDVPFGFDITEISEDEPALVARVEELEGALRALRALHTKVDGGVFVDKCSCKGPWPCPTAELLEEQ